MCPIQFQSCLVFSDFPNELTTLPGQLQSLIIINQMRSIILHTSEINIYKITIHTIPVLNEFKHYAMKVYGGVDV
jgi:hypothetical protein